MPLEIQYKLSTNNLYITYLREHNIWYKKLNRDPKLFNQFLEEMKYNYKLRTSDKISKVVDTVSVVSNLLSNMI